MMRIKRVRGSTWEWRALGAVPERAVADIPGVSYDALGYRGDVGAVAVMAHRLGLPEPPALPGPRPPKEAWLRPYQAQDVAHGCAALRATGAWLNATDIGLGKTREAISAVGAYLSPRVRTVVVCPAFVRRTWAEELVALGVASETIRLIEPGWRDKPPGLDITWLVTSYELADRVVAWTDLWSVDALIVDEAHLLRGRQTKRGTAVVALANMSGIRIAQTGTPLWSRPRDLYGLLNLLWPAMFGQARAFDIAYCNGHQGAWGWENAGASRLDELRLRLSYYMTERRREDAAREIPPLTRQVYWLDPSPKARSAATLLAAGAGPGALHGALRATLAAKVEAAVELAVAHQPVVVWTWMREDAHAIARAIETAGGRAIVLTGVGDGMTKLDHDTAVARALAAKASIVATIDAAGAGINGLQHLAHVQIFHALDWVPLKLIQAEGRLDRIGQTNPVLAIYLAMRDSADAWVARAVVEKLDHYRALHGATNTATDLDRAFSPTDLAASEDDALKAIYERMPA